MTKVHELAQKLYDALVWDERLSGEKFVKLDEEKKEPWMAEAIQTVHGEKFPDDTVYEWIRRSAEALSEAEGDDLEESDYFDVIYDMEGDVYTSDLTEWLHRRPDHVFYISEVLEEFVTYSDGFTLLRDAQRQQIQEVGIALLRVLIDLVEDGEEEDGEPVTN
jgi:hypothetical protein